MLELPNSFNQTTWPSLRDFQFEQAKTPIPIREKWREYPHSKFLDTNKHK